MSWADLSPRQLEVTQLLRWALSDKEIARYLELDAGTIKYHMNQARQRVGARNRSQLAIMACQELGFVEGPPALTWGRANFTAEMLEWCERVL